jgi:hypothetical protein
MPSRRSLIRTGAGAVALGAGVTVIPFGPWREDEASAATTITPSADRGSRASSQAVTVRTDQPNKILVHHTASANSTDLSRAHAHSLARSIQNDHMDRRGFIDTGQHFTIRRGGFVLEGRYRPPAGP